MSVDNPVTNRYGAARNVARPHASIRAAADRDVLSPRALAVKSVIPTTRIVLPEVASATRDESLRKPIAGRQAAGADAFAPLPAGLVPLSVGGFDQSSGREGGPAEHDGCSVILSDRRRAPSSCA